MTIKNKSWSVDLMHGNFIPKVHTFVYNIWD